MRSSLAGLLVCLCLQPAASGWGREGHRLIAQLAALHLNAKARAEVAKLLPGESLESIASWADEIRPQRKETSTWHYINLPVTAQRGDWRTYCPDSGCVVRTVSEMTAKLANGALPPAERAEALKFLVHFAGDLHQPLHAGDRGDRGGNDVPVIYKDRPTNLHSLWDTPIVEAAAALPGFSGRVGRRAGFFERRRLHKGSPEDWAWEAQAVSRDFAYGRLSAARPAPIDEGYVAAATPAVETQIRRAGLRLARLLNESLGR